MGGTTQAYMEAIGQMQEDLAVAARERNELEARLARLLDRITAAKCQDGAVTIGAAVSQADAAALHRSRWLLPCCAPLPCHLPLRVARLSPRSPAFGTFVCSGESSAASTATH